MSDFDEMLSALKEMKHEAADVPKYLAHLLDIQNKSRYINFHNFNSEKVSQILDDFWLFLMHSSSNSMNPSIRIAAVRSAAYLTLNLYPFYPNEIQSTFANIATISTIDMAASSLIASVFGIISYHISTPYRSHFLQSCPIFHHITEPKTNQEYFISSLSHYSHLGLEFHRAIIKSFMIKITSDPNDKLYWHAVIEIVSKEPKEHFLEVFNSLLENNVYQNYIQFMSCLLTIPDAPINKVNLFDIAKYALKILSDFSNNSHDLTINEKCGIFTILSLKTNSFIVECQIESDDILKITLTDATQTDSVEQKCQISLLNDIPEFYLLNLPSNLAFPNDDEGSTLLAAKLSLLITYLDSNDEELVQRILDTIKSYLSKPYDTTVSACYQGISRSIPRLKNRDVIDSLTKILDLTFFSPSLSWFHDMDRLKVIEALPLDSIARTFGNKSILPSFNQILKWAKEKNDKLAKYAQQVLIQSFIMQSDAEYLLAQVIKQSDIFDSFDLLRTLEILNMYLEKYKKQFTPKFLIDFCKSMMQMFQIYPDNPDLYIQILTFMSSFHIKKLRTFTIHICLAVVLSTYKIITGMDASFKEIDDNLIDQEFQMINSVMNKQSMDIIKENLNDYSSYAPHLYTTLRFLISIQNLDFKYVQLIVQYTINLFPYEASQLIFKHWKFLPQMNRTSFLSNNYEIIKNAGGFNCAGIWFELYMKASESVPDINANNSSSYQAVASGPFAYTTYSNRENFSSINSRIHFTNAFDCLKEFLDKSMDYLYLIDEKVLLYYIHFFKFVNPTKQFDYNLIPETKRARVISLINRIPSKSRKRRNKNHSSVSNFNSGKISTPLTQTSSAPIYENIKPGSLIMPQLTLPLAPTLIPLQTSQQDSQSRRRASNSKDDSNMNLLNDLMNQPIVNNQSNDQDDDQVDDQDDENNDNNFGNQSDVDSQSDSDEANSDSIILPTTITRSGSDSLSGSSSTAGSESGLISTNFEDVLTINSSAENSLIDLSPFVSDSFANSSRRSSFLSEIDSANDSPNISPSISISNSTLLQVDDNEVDHEDAYVGIYVPIDFIFTPPKVTTIDQLSEKLEVNDPLIEIQLKHDCYEFDDDELNEVYQYYLKENNQHILDLVFKYAEKHEIELEIPDEVKNRNGNVQTTKQLIASMKENDKINKKQLTKLCHELNNNQIHYQHSLPRHKRKNSELEKEEPEEDKEILSIINKLLNCLTESTKESKIKMLLFTLGNIFCTYSKIPFETAKLIITNFNENFNKLPQNELGVCIEAFCQRVCKKGRPAKFLARMQTITSIFNVGGENIINSLAMCRLLTQKEATSITTRFLSDKSLPSSFRNSVILMTLIAGDPNLSSIDLFNGNIQSFMNVYKTFKRNEPIHRQVAIYFNAIFKERNFETIGRNNNIIMSTFQFPSNSLYTSYSLCIPRYAKFILWNSKTLNDLKDSRLIPFCKEYFELLNVEIQSSDDKKNFTLKKIEAFIEALEKGKVCIERLDKYILSWFLFLNQFFKFESIVKRLMPLAKVSFFPFFLGIVRFVKFHKKKLSGDEIKMITKWKVEAHSNAFKFALTNNVDLVNAAIQLSFYEEDNDESDDLIRKCEKYYKKLTEKQ